jgi:TFIIF-interacting CTD phosphatase-like protein
MEKKFINGFQNWIETYYEMVDYLATTSDYSGSMSNMAREQGGRTAQYVLAEQLTDEFEEKYHENYDTRFDEEGYTDTIEAFLIDKGNKHYRETH